MDWRPKDPDKTEIGQVNLVPGWAQNKPLTSIATSELAGVIGLGRPTEYLHKADITTVRLLFVHLMQKVRQNPSEDNLKKLLLLPTVLFCTNPKPQYPRENLRHKACLILADDWSLFTVNAFPGRTRNTNYKADRANFYKFVSPGPSAPKTEVQECEIRRRASN